MAPLVRSAYRNRNAGRYRPRAEQESADGNRARSEPLLGEIAE